MDHDILYKLRKDYLCNKRLRDQQLADKAIAQIDADISLQANEIVETGFYDVMLKNADDDIISLIRMHYIGGGWRLSQLSIDHDTVRFRLLV